MRKLIVIYVALLGTHAFGQIFTDPEWKAIYELGRQAYEKGAWLEAYDKFSQILIKHPQRINLKYERALCLKNLDRGAEAIEEFEEIVDLHRSHILSNHQLALLHMQKKDRTQEDEQEARRRLREAAQYGFDAVGAIETQEALSTFRADVAFILELIRAPTEREKITADALVDPFKDLLVPKGDLRIDPPVASTTDETTAVVTTTLDLQKQREYLELIISLLTEIEERLHFKEEEMADELFREVEELVLQVREYEHEELVELRAQALDKYDSIFENIQIVRLKRFEREASAIIDKMKLHIEQSQFAQVETDYQELQRHLSSTNKDDLMIQQVAKVWTNKGLKWLRVSRKLREAASIQIQLSGVVFGKDSDRSVAQAIVNEQILAEGDGVRDVGGNPIPRLKVKKIGRNYVRFYYEGVEFDWYMGLDTPIGFKYVEDE